MNRHSAMLAKLRRPRRIDPVSRFEGDLRTMARGIDVWYSALDCPGYFTHEPESLDERARALTRLRAGLASLPPDLSEWGPEYQHLQPQLNEVRSMFAAIIRRFESLD